MTLKIYYIDAFANKVFEGNPAAVIPLEHWLEEDILQKIAQENNLSETAYFVPTKKGYTIRWFTPLTEVNMCGHATLATAHVLFNELKKTKNSVLFYSNSGNLMVEQKDNYLSMDFPLQHIAPSKEFDIFEEIFNVTPIAVYQSMDYIVVFENEEIIKNLNPHLELLKTLDLRGVIVTAKSTHYDFVCRFFAPKLGIDEDPVTGSAFTQLLSYWHTVLKKTTFISKQISKRGEK
ncbi:MAG: PhzF family phenazine biosynthesis protein [Sulfurimonadaceae bacterium]